MSLLVTCLLALPAADPAGPFDGAWTIVSVAYNDKTLEAKAPVTIRRNRLVLNEGKGLEEITIELLANNRALLWSGKNKPPTQPPPPEKVPLATGPITWGVDGKAYVWEEQRWRFAEAIMIELPAPYVKLATPGFYVPLKDQLQIFFLPVDDSWPSLSMALRKNDK